MPAKFVRSSADRMGRRILRREGSTIAYFPNKKSRYLRVEASVPQSGHGSDVPEVLQRVRTAMLGMGKIVGPNEYGIYLWKTRGLEETQATIALLWRYLGPVKRSQASAAIRQVLDRYWSGQLTARRSRRARHHHMDHAVLIALEPGADVVERAWAAGFLDAEGCFGTYHSRSRKSAPGLASNPCLGHAAWSSWRAGECAHTAATSIGGPRPN